MLVNLLCFAGGVVVTLVVVAVYVVLERPKPETPRNKAHSAFYRATNSKKS